VRVCAWMTHNDTLFHALSQIHVLFPFHIFFFFTLTLAVTHLYYTHNHTHTQLYAPTHVFIEENRRVCDARNEYSGCARRLRCGLGTGQCRLCIFPLSNRHSTIALRVAILPYHTEEYIPLTSAKTLILNLARFAPCP